jgi:hypothetical protein
MTKTERRKPGNGLGAPGTSALGDAELAGAAFPGHANGRENGA